MTELFNVALLGRAGSGKDTVAEYLIRRYQYTRLAFADPVREMLYRLNPIASTTQGEYVRVRDLVDTKGWDAAKLLPDVRVLLQRLGTDCVRDMLGPNVWVHLLQEHLTPAAKLGLPLVVTDCRFPNELGMLRQRGFMTVWVERPGAGLRDEAGEHASETGLVDVETHYVLQNHGTLGDLHDRIETMMTRW